MSPLSRLSILVSLLVFMESALVFAGRPLTIDDAAPVATGQLEFELGFSHHHSHGGGRDQRWPVLGATYGIFQRLEVGLAIQRVDQDGSGTARIHGFEDLHLNSKYNFIEESPALPAIAGALDIKLPTANRTKSLSTGSSNQSLLLIVTKTLSPFMINVNLGYTIVGDQPNARVKNLLHGGAAMEWLFAQQWSLVGEITGASRIDSTAKNEANFQLGARFSALANLLLDFAIGRSLRPTGTAVQGTFGLTWTIDLTKTPRR